MSRSPPFLRCTPKFRAWKPEFCGPWIEKESAVAEIFGVSIGVPEIIVDEHGGLPRKLKAFAAFETCYKVVQPHHERSRLGKLSAVLFTGAARQFPLFAGDFPAHGKLEFAAAARADELDLSGFFLFGVKRAFVHG
jgi:hypothetical protein